MYPPSFPPICINVISNCDPYVNVIGDYVCVFGTLVKIPVVKTPIVKRLAVKIPSGTNLYNNHYSEGFSISKEPYSYTKYVYKVTHSGKKPYNIQFVIKAI